jgi:predicted RNase H-like HicB family nuclease
MKQLGQYLALPWTVETGYTDGALVISVVELPGFFAAGRTADEAEANFWEALSSHLASFIEVGEEPPQPQRSLRQRQLGRNDPRVETEFGVEPGRRSFGENRHTDYQLQAA